MQWSLDISRRLVVDALGLSGLLWHHRLPCYADSIGIVRPVSAHELSQVWWLKMGDGAQYSLRMAQSPFSFFRNMSNTGSRNCPIACEFAYRHEQQGLPRVEAQPAGGEA